MKYIILILVILALLGIIYFLRIKRHSSSTDENADGDGGSDVDGGGD